MPEKGNTEWLNWDLDTLRLFLEEYKSRPKNSGCSLCREFGYMHPQACIRELTSGSQ